MTPKEAITKLDGLMPNNYDEATKLGWLTELDGRVMQEIFAVHELNEGEELPDWSEYTEENMDSAELLIPAPYTDTYMFWLQSMIHYFNQETNHYNNATVMFNTAWRTYANHYRRTHLPVSVGRKWF